MDSPSVLGRIVTHLEAGRLLPEGTLTLVSEDGALPITYALGTEAFRAGDLVEIRLLRRDGKVGETARVLAPNGRPLAEPVPYDYHAEVRYPDLDDDDPFLK